MRDKNAVEILSLPLILSANWLPALMLPISMRLKPWLPAIPGLRCHSLPLHVCILNASQQPHFKTSQRKAHIGSTGRVHQGMGITGPSQVSATHGAFFH